jgi:hypothetical protein
MDKTALAQQLRQAEEHVARGEIYLRRQRRIIELLEQPGSHAAAAAAAAKALLEDFETSQNRLIAHRDRIERLLAELSEKAVSIS